VRGDATLTARLLLRGPGLAGLTTVAGGGLAAIAATRPWYLGVAELSMLGDQQGRTVATLAGVPGTVSGWLVVLLGVCAAVLGTNVALDRPHPHARRLLLLTATLLLLLAAVVSWWRPPLERVAAGDAARLLELAERLPSGVELVVSVRPGLGPALVALAAVLVGGGALAARDG
jgi:hypothetical protein